MTKYRGSQIRDKLKLSGYVLVKRISPKQVILKEIGENHCELWVKNDHFAGYVIEITGYGYEYAQRVVCPKLRKKR